MSNDTVITLEFLLRHARRTSLRKRRQRLLNQNGGFHAWSLMSESCACGMTKAEYHNNFTITPCPRRKEWARLTKEHMGNSQ